MNVHISYKIQRTPDIDKEMQHWTSKIQKRLQVFRPELIHLKGLVEQNSAREGATVSLNLRLPSGQMAAQESAPTPAAAVKAVFGDLLSQICRHKDLLRSSHRGKGKRAANGRAFAVPFEQTFAAIPPLTATADDVRSYVNVNFRRLSLFAQRQLFFRESSTPLQPDSISSEEIVDEVVARALDDSIEKPDRMGLEPWLYRLAIQAMGDLESRLVEAESDVHLQGVPRRRNELASDEPRLQFHQPDETLTTESSIADVRTSTPEQIAYSDEMIALIQFALRAVAPQDREVFVLYALEGFSTDEIVAITDRGAEEVGESIRKARSKVREAFPGSNPFESRRLQPTGTH